MAVAAVGVLLVAGAGCSSDTSVVPEPTATPLPVASLSGLEPVDLPGAGTARCLIGEPGDPDLVEVAVTRDDDGLSRLSWSGAAEVGGDADLGWYLLATAVEGGAAYEVGATSAADGVTAFVTDVEGRPDEVPHRCLRWGRGRHRGRRSDRRRVGAGRHPGLEGPIEWSAIATVDGQEIYSCSAA